jgi:hypothetical protein
VSKENPLLSEYDGGENSRIGWLLAMAASAHSRRKLTAS